MSQAEDRFWAWSTGIYGQPEVKDALLRLQDRHGFSVNAVLWAAWAASEGYTLSDAETAKVLSLVTDLDGYCVYPMRSVRRFLTAPHQGVDRDMQQALRKQILAAELSAEKLIQFTLARATDALANGPLETPDPRTIIERANQYFTVCGENLETPHLLADDEGPNPPRALFEVVLRSAGWLEED